MITKMNMKPFSKKYMKKLVSNKDGKYDDTDADANARAFLVINDVSAFPKLHTAEHLQKQLK